MPLRLHEPFLNSIHPKKITKEIQDECVSLEGSELKIKGFEELRDVTARLKSLVTAWLMDAQPNG